MQIQMRTLLPTITDSLFDRLWVNRHKQSRMALVAAKIIDPYENHRILCPWRPVNTYDQEIRQVDIVVKNSKNKSVDTIKALEQ